VTHLFGFSLDQIAIALAIACAALLVLEVLLGAHRRLLVRMALRQLPRRRAQMVLIVVGLALGASIITSVFLTGDTVESAIHGQVVEGLGGIDEILHDASGPYSSGDVDLSALTGLDTATPGASTEAVFLDYLSGRMVTGPTPPPQVYFPYAVFQSMQAQLAHSHWVAALMPEAVEQNAMVTDVTTRQIRGEVKVIGLPTRWPAAFGALSSGRHPVGLAQLPAGTLALNQIAANDLGARPGDHLLLFLGGGRFTFRLAAIAANGGLASAVPEAILPLQALNRLTGHVGAIDRILAVNTGNDEAAAAANSDLAAADLAAAAPGNLAIDEAKAEGLRQSEQAEEIFSRIFTLFALFSAGVGLLLVFLIFTILAADRRTEMGISRAIGLTRRDLVVLYVHEGTVYAAVAAALGVGLGIGIGAAIIGGLNLFLGNFGFILALAVQPRVLIISFCLGLVSTWLTVVVACWWATRLSVSSAVRDLPEPGDLPPGLLRILVRPAVRFHYRLFISHDPGRAVRQLPRDLVAALVEAALALCALGPGLVGIGALLVLGSQDMALAGLLPAGITMGLIGVTLTIRWLLRSGGVAATTAGRVAFSAGGLALIGYWAVPPTIAAQGGVSTLHTGIELFFLSGVTMVLGAVWLAVYNMDGVLKALTRALSLPGRASAVVRTSIAYTLHRPARTGLILAMFGLVSFTLTVMAVVTDALQRTYGDISMQTGGFDIRGDLLFNDPIPSLKGAMQHSPYVNLQPFSFAGTQGYIPIGVVQLSAAQPGWRLAYANVLGGDFLTGDTFHLLARARGYINDAAVWRALRSTPWCAVIGSDMLPGGGNAAFPSGGTNPAPFALSGNTGAGFAPITLWLADPAGGRAIRVRVIGIAVNSDGRHGGVVISSATLRAAGAPPVLAASFFRVKPGENPTMQARRLGSAFLDHGLQTTVLASAVLLQRGPKILLARLLQGFVGLVLLLGIAGLAAATMRNVVERRQQIGMLRALGMPRALIRAAILLESSAIALAGLAIGVTLGLLLARNLFLADFFEQYQTGLTMQVPWRELTLIVGLTYGVAMLATLLPARLAGKISPAEALLDR
jgi:putative ABC transport system permease protein